uniref:Uncharacterized protein n=1 Tax=Romanomermis culicivorax TaxID=13658 RepID=A0A915KTF6_ROMCU
MDKSSDDDDNEFDEFKSFMDEDICLGGGGGLTTGWTDGDLVTFGIAVLEEVLKGCVYVGDASFRSFSNKKLSTLISILPSEKLPSSLKLSWPFNDRFFSGIAIDTIIRPKIGFTSPEVINNHNISQKSIKICIMEEKYYKTASH